jgi:hypothetical protein
MPLELSFDSAVLVHMRSKCLVRVLYSTVKLVFCQSFGSHCDTRTSDSYHRSCSLATTYCYKEDSFLLRLSYCFLDNEMIEIINRSSAANPLSYAVAADRA